MFFLAEQADHFPLPKPTPKTAVSLHMIRGDVALEAKAAYVYDLKTREVLFSRNENDVLPLASLTKIMTAYTAESLYPATSTVAIRAADLQMEGDTGLLANEKWSLSGLLKFTLLSSSNDGASAIASIGLAFPEKNPPQNFLTAMNENAARLGFSGMRFLNESGLDIDSQTSGGYGSAKEISLLFAESLARYPDLFASTGMRTENLVSESGISHKIETTNDAWGEIPAIISSKTGYTESAGGNLSIIFDASIGHPVIVTVLGSSRDGRFSDVSLLAKEAIAAVNGTTEPAAAPNR